MRTFASIAATTIGLLTLASQSLAEAPSGTLQFKFEKRRAHELPKRDVRRQLWERQSDGTANVQIFNADLLYLVNATVGSPPQNIALQLDTGSSDIWFPDANSDYCAQSSRACPFGAFDFASSESADRLSDRPSFQISYVDGTETTGVYFTDTLDLSGTTVNNVTMAYATQFDRAIGVMGIGFRNGESSAFYRQDAFTYPNVINTMVESGLIQSTSYSLWLDDLGSDTGSILFGGVDTDKYTGSLVSLPMQADAASSSDSEPLFTAFTVAWTGLRVTGNGNDVDVSPSAAQPAILDSGTSLTFLPDDIAQRLIDGFGAFAVSGGAYALPCDTANNNITLSFTFGGSDEARIDVPVSEMVVPLPTRSGRAPTLDGVEICQFGIIPAGQNPILFGDTFLRSAYVVYDLDNLQIGLAQTNFQSNDGTGNVQPIASGSGIPDVTLTASAVTVDNTFTGNPLFTAGATNVDNLTGNPTKSATFNLTSSGHANEKNIAGRSSVDGSFLASMVVVAGAFLFGAMLI